MSNPLVLLCSVATLFATGTGCSAPSSGPPQPEGVSPSARADKTATAGDDASRGRDEVKPRRVQRSESTDRNDDHEANPEAAAGLIPLPPSLRQPVRALEHEIAEDLNKRGGDQRIARIRPLSPGEKAALEPDFRQPGPITMDHLIAIDVRFRRLDGSDGFGRLVVAEYFSHQALDSQRSPQRGYWKKLDRAGDRRPIARELAGFFRANYRADQPYPIDRVLPLHYFRQLAEEQGIDIDELSMRHNNTYAFAIRKVRGTSVWSRHAIGAIDINPLYNPIISRTAEGKRNQVNMGKLGPTDLEAGYIRVEPLGSLPYAFTRRELDDRRVIRGKNAALVRYLVPRGWMWGGQWRTMKDYHHFAPDRKRR